MPSKFRRLTRKQIESMRKKIRAMGYTDVYIKLTSDKSSYRVKGKINGSWRMNTGDTGVRAILKAMRQLRNPRPIKASMRLVLRSNELVSIPFNSDGYTTPDGIWHPNEGEV